MPTSEHLEEGERQEGKEPQWIVAKLSVTLCCCVFLLIILFHFSGTDAALFGCWNVLVSINKSLPGLLIVIFLIQPSHHPRTWSNHNAPCPWWQRLAQGWLCDLRQANYILYLRFQAHVLKGFLSSVRQLLINCKPEAPSVLALSPSYIHTACLKHRNDKTRRRQSLREPHFLSFSNPWSHL